MNKYLHIVISMSINSVNVIEENDFLLFYEFAVLVLTVSVDSNTNLDMEKTLLEKLIERMLDHLLDSRLVFKETISAFFSQYLMLKDPLRDFACLLNRKVINSLQKYSDISESVFIFVLSCWTDQVIRKSSIVDFVMTDENFALVVQTFEDYEQIYSENEENGKTTRKEFFRNTIPFLVQFLNKSLFAMKDAKRVQLCQENKTKLVKIIGLFEIYKEEDIVIYELSNVLFIVLALFEKALPETGENPMYDAISNNKAFLCLCEHFWKNGSDKIKKAFSHLKHNLEILAGIDKKELHENV